MGVFGDFAINEMSKQDQEILLLRKMIETLTEKPTHPVGVSVLLHRNGKVLLGERKNNSGSGLLSTPGGRIEKNETIPQCAARELKEETGIDLFPERFTEIYHKEHFRFNNHYFMFYVMVECPEGVEPINLEPDRCISWDWYPFYPRFEVPFEKTTEPKEVINELFMRTGYTPIDVGIDDETGLYVAMFDMVTSGKTKEDAVKKLEMVVRLVSKQNFFVREPNVKP